LYYVHFTLLREVQVPVNMLFNHVDAYVLNYNSGVWGFNNDENIERVL